MWNYLQTLAVIAAVAVSTAKAEEFEARYPTVVYEWVSAKLGESQGGDVEIAEGEFLLSTMSRYYTLDLEIAMEALAEKRLRDLRLEHMASTSPGMFSALLPHKADTEISWPTKVETERERGVRILTSAMLRDMYRKSQRR